MLLLFKATSLSDGLDEDNVEGSGIIEASGGGGDFEGSGLGDDDGGGDEEDALELVHMDEKYFYAAHGIRIMAIIHSIVSLAMLVAYYHLKVQRIDYKTAGGTDLVSFPL